MRRNQRIDKDIRRMAAVLEKEGRFALTQNYIQHGQFSVYDHCMNVAYMSCLIAEKMKFHVDRRSLIRGALLHDYFLYDWHEKDRSHRLHGFFHPKKALNNARMDFRLTEREENIISRHMFPLTIKPPSCREAWIVCMADKICASEETIRAVQRQESKREEHYE